jgi:hypothetical protein
LEKKEARVKFRFFSLFLILTILSLAYSVRLSAAQAYGTAFTTTIIFQNPTLGPANNIQIVYYATASTKDPISIPRPSLPGGMSTSIFIGTIGNAFAGFHGTMYIQSEPHLVAIQMQAPHTNSVVKVRPVTNLPPSGSPMVLFASVLRNYYHTNTVFTLQNIDSQINVIRINFYTVDAALAYSFSFLLEPGASYIFDAGKVQDNPLPDPFNGSAVVTTTRMDLRTPGNIMGSAMELDNIYLGANSFEGLAHGSLEVFMPSAACDFDLGGHVLVNTAYAVQNNSLFSPTEVTVSYSNGTSHTQTIGPGAKGSFVACQAPGMPENYSGAAVIRSSAAPVVVIGKTFGAGLSTAFTGTLAGSATRNLALPYIRWASDENWNNGTQQRTFISLQNAGTQTIHGKIWVYYIPCHGDIATHVISLGNDGLAPGAKVTSNPSRAGIEQIGSCGRGPQAGGSAIVAGPENSQLAAVVRVEQWDNARGSIVGDDYNGIIAP